MTPRFLELPAWERVHHRIETCPWAGPRPLRNERSADARQFVGRARDRAGFMNDVIQSSVVALTAESGVGKTSMLEMALRPDLEDKGFEVFYCDRWTVADPGAFEADRYFASYFDIPLDRTGGGDGPTSFAAWLDREHGSRAVLILDQFEELIRYSPRLWETISDWIAQMSAGHRFKIVVSLRAEYVHRLRELESKIGPWKMSRYVLEPIRDRDEIRELIRSANVGDRSEIGADAVEAIVDLWSAPVSDAPPPGLLELHALLYSLYWVRWERRRDRIDAAIVDDFVTSAGPAGPFARALDASVRWKLDLCELAMAAGAHEDLDSDEPIDLRPYFHQLQTGYDDFAALQLTGGEVEGAGLPADVFIVNGTRGCVEKLVRHLSSGGYKLVREEWELGQRTLERELELLAATAGQVDRLVDGEGVERLFRRLGTVRRNHRGEDLLTVGWDRLLDPAVLEEILALEHAWDADLDHLSSSAMLGLHPLLVLIEEMRRLHFGLEWLRISDLIRITSPSANQTMVSLIHDGFGPALDNWSRSRDRPLNRLTRITASKGETFDWLRDDGKVWPSFDEQTIVNIRWHDCEIRAHFRRVAFVNCDFRGCRFQDCVFEGALFLNCLLDGAAVNDSVVIGPVNAVDELPQGIHHHQGVGARPPSFEVAMRPTEVEVLSRYRAVDTGTVPDGLNSLISHTSGLPALPFDAAHHAVFAPELVDGQPWRMPWVAERGGLSMYGGRLCSLMVARTVFAEGGTIALRLVAGSGLDLVEHVEGALRLDVHGSAIRGLTITGVEGKTTDVDIRVGDALLVGTWLGDGLRGTASFVNDELWQLMNLNPRSSLRTELTDCAYHGVVNVEAPEVGSRDLSGDYRMASIAHLAEAVALGSRMDYESDPARAEYERREAQTDPECPRWPRTTTIDG